MTRVLYVEDDANLSRSVPPLLRSEGFQVDLARSLGEGRERIGAGSYQVIVLDWMLPDGQGIDWLRDLKLAGNATPVILLTARTELVDRVLGLETGANDYLTKPFEPRELVARIRVQVRLKTNTAMPADHTIEAGPILIRTDSREVTYQGKNVELARMEFELLKMFCENPNRVFSREELLNRVWGFERYPTTRTVDTHILQLRGKFSEKCFETVRGVGYRLKI